MKNSIQEFSYNSVLTMPTKRFQIALSFPGEKRDYVLQVAELLANTLGKDAVFYDDWYKHELARPNLDTYLQNIYHQESQLIVPFLCSDYERKEWCGLEWRSLRDLIKKRQDADIMPLRFDNTHISGLFTIDGYIDLQKHTPEETAELILKRLQVNNNVVENLQNTGKNLTLLNNTTLLQIGSKIIFYARWVKTTANQWRFILLSNPLKGDINEINRYVEGFDRLIETERYVVIELLGDARVISSPPILNKDGDNIFLTLSVKNPPRYETEIKSSIGLKDNDLFLDSNNNMAIFKGIDAVFQNISTTLGTKKGECYFNPENGSIIGEYFEEYKNNLELLSRLFKMELCRLYFVKFHENSSSHVKRFNDVKIQSNVLVNQFLNVEISIVLENDEEQTKIVPIFIGL